MGLLLQDFYRHCSFLPLGFGMAGQAFESGQYRWASGEELLLQIRFLSTQNQLPTPPELHVLNTIGLTVLYIPLENGAGVLEIGTKELVPKSESGRIYQILGFVNELAIEGTSRGDQTMSLCFEAGTKALPINDAGNQYGNADEQYKITSMMENYVDSAILRHPYWSSTSTTSSSMPSAGDQMGNNSHTTFAMNTSPAQVSSMNNEDINSFDELDILNQLDQIDMNSVSMPISVPDFNSYGLNNANSIHYDHHHHLPELPLNFSSTNLSASPLLLSPIDNSRYLDPHSGPNHNHLLECVFQPMQCAFSTRNDVHIDAHHCLNEIVRGPSLEPNIACQQTEATGISCLPSVTSCTQLQASSHSASFSNDHEHRKWRDVFPSINEEEKMNDLFPQSEGHVHATVSAVIAKSRPLAGSLGNKKLECNKDQRIMQEQGAALMTEEEGSTRRNRRLFMGLSRANSECYEAFIDDKISEGQREKVVVSSTVTSTRQTAGGYVGYAFGSAEAEKGVSYGSYASGSAEAEKVVALSIYGAGGLNIGSGNRDEHYKVQQQDDQCLAIPYESNASPAQVHHIHAERKRRRRQSECINTLRTLLPNIPKKANKVAIFESTIQHIEELKSRICDLEEENSALTNLTFKEKRMSLEVSSHSISRSQHATSVQISRQNISSQENATCYYVQGAMPHFRLGVIKNVEDVNVNGTIINIMNALQKENLYCYEINSEFWKDTSEISIEILAHHKDEGNYNPTLDEIQRVEQWWKHLA